MKASVFSQSVGQLLFFFFFLCFILPLPPVFAEDLSAQSATDLYNQQELAQMLAPIALYPDALLSQILMASTYPIEVIEADRWVKRNSHLEADYLDDALYSKEWDPSVKALCHFPSTLARMSEQITETTNLGNAFLAQEDDMMEMVQHLREKAYAEGNLHSTRQQKVIVEGETIVIEPVHPQTIYIPYYDPYYVYGSWWYPAYSPYYWGPSGVRLGFGVSFYPGIYLNFAFGSWSYFDWPHHVIYINTHKRPRFIRKERVVSRRVWQHIPRHRRGVAYRDKRTAQTYGQAPHRSQESRRESRGYSNGHNTIQHTMRNETNTRKTVKIKNKVFLQKKKQQKQMTHTTRKQPQIQSSGSRVLKQQPLHHNTRPEQNTRRMIQTKGSAPRQERQPPQIRVPVQPKQEEQWQEREHESVFSRVINGTSERQSSRRGKASRRVDPGR